ncbi:hypothetical protein TSUD_20640 [Trifolium subterraneum]|uniref:Secreted protein n=1 Tax=Trifolium subterraneum TaxID=3900 RepID=A0A2Z6NWH6_TRISU|nr:hypothetical protein TSUD_20640 [Trifolium subterraneum]
MNTGRKWLLLIFGGILHSLIASIETRNHLASKKASPRVKIAKAREGRELRCPAGTKFFSFVKAEYYCFLFRLGFAPFSFSK